MQVYGDVRQLEVLPMGSECKCANRAVSE